MREIKFRGKTGTVKGDIWAYGYLYKVKSLLDDNYRYYIRNDHLQDCLVDEETIGQYTGLKDKNGKEIYEGDIIEYKDSTGLHRKTVVFDKGCFYAGWHSGSSTREAPKLINTRISKVIGNIYESEEEDADVCSNRLSLQKR